MTDKDEVKRRLRDADDCLKCAEEDYKGGRYRACVQNAQLCCELSCKGMISYFAEPTWKHDPSEELLGILESKEKEIITRFGEKMVTDIRQLSEDVKVAAPWHGQSVYGKEAEDGTWISAVDLCTEEVALDLLNRARHSLKTLKAFIDKISKE